jgi:large subunit ribosomal protein L30
MKEEMVRQLKVTYTKSAIGYAHDQKRTIASLGLRKLNQTALLPDNPSVRGMIFKVRHLVTVEEVAGDNAPQAASRPRVRIYEREQAV